MMKYVALVFLVIGLAFGLVFLTESSSLAGNEILITPEELSSLLDTPGVVIIDARGKENYDEGHIPGSVSLPFTRILELRDDAVMKNSGKGLSVEAAEKLFSETGLGNDSKIVVYDSPPDVAASFVWVVLKIYGADNVRILTGGIRAWEKANLQLTKEPVPIKPSVFKANPESEIVVTTDWILKNRDNVLLIDGRSLDEYVGARGSGRIPGALFLEWKDLAAMKDSFKSQAKIEEILTKAGVTKDKEIVTYCEIGPKASFLYAALKMLGYNVKFYWGSMREWAEDPNRPVAKK